MSPSCLVGREITKKARDSFGAFYLRRLFRIYPLSMFCVTSALLLNRALDVAQLVWIASVPLAILQLHTSDRLNVLSCAPRFIAGVMAWKLSLSVPRRLPGLLWPVGFVLTWPLFFLATHQNDMCYRWAFCMELGLMIPHFQDISFRPVKVAAHFVAKYSYGIYLSHIAAIMWSFALPVPVAVKWVVFVVVAVVVPVAMYHLLAHPLIGVGQKLADRLFGQAGSTRLVKVEEVTPAIS